MIATTLILILGLAYYAIASGRLFTTAERRTGRHELDLEELVGIGVRAIPRELDGRFSRPWDLMFRRSPDPAIEEPRRRVLAALGAWVILGVVAFVYGSQVEAEVVSMASLQPAYAIVMGIATAVAVVWLEALCAALVSSHRTAQWTVACAAGLIASMVVLIWTPALVIT